MIRESLALAAIAGLSALSLTQTTQPAGIAQEATATLSKRYALVSIEGDILSGQDSDWGESESFKVAPTNLQTFGGGTAPSVSISGKDLILPPGDYFVEVNFALDNPTGPGEFVEVRVTDGLNSTLQEVFLDTVSFGMAPASTANYSFSFTFFVSVRSAQEIAVRARNLNLGVASVSATSQITIEEVFVQ